MLRYMYFRESIKNNNDRKEEYLIPFSKKNSLNKTGVSSAKFALSKLLTSRSTGALELKKKLDVTLCKRNIRGKNEPLTCVYRSVGKRNKRLILGFFYCSYTFSNKL